MLLSTVCSSVHARVSAGGAVPAVRVHLWGNARKTPRLHSEPGGLLNIWIVKRAGTKLNKSKRNDLMVHVTPPSSLRFLWIDVGLNHKIHCYVSGSNLMALMELMFITDTGSNLLLLYLKEHSGNATPPCSARAILKLWCFIMFLL